MSSSPRKRFCSGKQQQYIPNSQAFLNLLSISEAEAWKDEIIKAFKCVPFINHRHLPTTLTPDQLKTLKSDTEHGGDIFFINLKMIHNLFILGTFFENWMECIVAPENIANPQRCHPNVRINVDSPYWPSISKVSTDFSRSNSVKSIRIKLHHIVAKSTMQMLPLLSINSGDAQGMLFISHRS
jgi:hypothetical protein